MKQKLSTIARSGLLALGLSVLAVPATATALGMAGPTLSGAVEHAASEASVTKVGDRRYYRGSRRHYRPRYSRPSVGIYMGFGVPGPYYRRPYYPRPYYARPYYPQRYYVRPSYPRPVYRQRVNLSRAHVSWCYNRYRSYRDWDNTFQPYNGPRRVCVSPYYR